MAKEIAKPFLTAQETELIGLLADGKPLDESAALARYPSLTAARAALATPHVRLAVRERVNTTLQCEVAPAAARYLLDVLLLKVSATRGVLDAAREGLARAGFVPPRASDGKDDKDKPLSDYSRDELLGILAQAEEAKRRLADQARPVLEAKAESDVSRHDDAPPEPNPSDLLD